MKKYPLRPFGLSPFEAPKGWSLKSKVTTLAKGEGADKRVVGFRVQNEEKNFVIPVLDNRYDPGVVSAQIKANNIQRGSKYFKPSYSVLGYSYNEPKPWG